MADSPQFADPDGSELRVDDINGDGLDDLVQVRFNAIDVWLNIDGTGWTKNRHIAFETPINSPLGHRVRLVDINGSGTRDILFGDGNAYKYIDLLGGERPWVLTRVQNGLGKSTELEYASSVSLMLAAAKAGPNSAWKSTTPSPMHVVVKSTERDHGVIATGGCSRTAFPHGNPHKSLAPPAACSSSPPSPSLSFHPA